MFDFVCAVMSSKWLSLAMDVTAIGPQLMGIGSTSNANTRRPQAVVAANVIPVGAYTLPVSYKLDLKKIFDLTPVVNIISVSYFS